MHACHSGAVRCARTRRAISNLNDVILCFHIYSKWTKKKSKNKKHNEMRRQIIIAFIYSFWFVDRSIYVLFCFAICLCRPKIIIFFNYYFSVCEKHCSAGNRTPNSKRFVQYSIAKLCLVCTRVTVEYLYLSKRIIIIQIYNENWGRHLYSCYSHYFDIFWCLHCVWWL